MTHNGAVKPARKPFDIVDTTPSAVNPAIAPASER
jgi:hypothetical protein